MAEWKRNTDDLDFFKDDSTKINSDGAQTPASDDNSRVESKDSAPVSFEVTDESVPAHSSDRFNTRGYRRGRSKAAAPVGFLVLVLALVGVVTLIIAGIGAIIRSQDNSELRNELFVLMRPVIRQQTRAFTDVDSAEQDELLLSALWYLTNKEQIRMMQERTIISKYAADDNERWKISEEDVLESYRRLFGPDAEIFNRTVGEPGSIFSVEYNETEKFFHVPLSVPSTLYETVADTLVKKGDDYILRVCYVSTNKIAIDDDGQFILPKPEEADYVQLFTLQRVGEDGWKLVSIADEGPSVTTYNNRPTDDFSQDVGGFTGEFDGDANGTQPNGENNQETTVNANEAS